MRAAFFLRVWLGFRYRWRRGGLRGALALPLGMRLQFARGWASRDRRWVSGLGGEGSSPPWVCGCILLGIGGGDLLVWPLARLGL